MDVEKSDREKAEDETEALGLIRASLDEETLDYIDGAPNAKRCWTMLRMRYKISTDQQHAKLIEKVFQDMEWKEGDRMFQKWLKIQNKFGEIPNFEHLLDGTTTACMTTRLIIHLWANRLPRNIATILERHLKLSQGKWTDIMYKIDDEIDSLPKNFQKTSSSSASNQTRPDQSQQRSKTKCFFCTKLGHRESECRTKKTWERRNITANMSLMDENPSKKTPNHWIVDSASTHNLTGDLTKIYSLRKIDPIPVFWGGLRLDTRMVGLAKINVGGAYIVINVYHVEGLNHNLLSVKKLCRKGLEVTATESRAFIRRGRRYTNLIERDGLYTTPCVETEKPVATQMSYEEAHVKFGHAGEQKLRKIHQQSADKETWTIAAKPDNFHCQVCVKGKITKINGHSHNLASQEPLDLIHMDISGPHPTAVNKAQYYIIVVDDSSKYKWVLPIQHRRDAPDVLNDWKRQIELKMGKTIKAFRTDNAPELKKLTLRWQKDGGSDAQFTIPGTSSQNGTAERAIRTINDSTRTMILDASMPTMFWPYAAVHAAFIANRASITESKSPFELFFSIPPNATHIHRWGCKIIFHNAHDKNPNTQQRNKMDARGREGILLLIDEKVTGRYICWDIKKRKAFITESLKFFESNPGGSLLDEIRSDDGQLEPARSPENDTGNKHTSNVTTGTTRQETSDEQTPFIIDTAPNDEEEHDEEERDEDEPEPQMDTTPLDGDSQMEDIANEEPITADIQTDQEHGDTQTMQTTQTMQRTETPMDIDTPDNIQERINRQLQDLYTRGILKRPYAQIQQRGDKSDDPAAKRIRAMMTKLAEREPRTYTEAVNHPTLGTEWREAIETEVKTLRKFGTWTEVPYQKGMKLITTKFVFKIKPGIDDQPRKLKARLVAQGFKQIRGLDFHETYAPTPRQATTRIFFALVCTMDLECHKVDATNAFAQAELGEMVHLTPPPSLHKNGVVWKLNKALYGLKQASYAWRNKIAPCLAKLGLIQCPEDECIMIDPKKGIMILIYVNDIAVAGPNKETIQKFISGLANMIGIKDMGELKTFLGLEVSRDRGEQKMWLTQTHYINKMAEELDMTAHRARPIGAPIGSWDVLEQKQPGEKAADKATFQSILGTLMYPSVMTRPDIAFATSSLSQHTSDPAERHLDAAKRVARYLRDTNGYGIEFTSPRRGGTYEFLVGYSDADYANSKDRRSVSGMVYTLANGPIHWKSQKQRSVATSTTEAEYIGFTPCAKEGIWLNRLVNWCLEQLKTAPNISQTAQLIKVKNNTLMYGDNQAALKIAGNLGASSKTKHIDIQYHAVKEWIRDGKITLKYVTTDNMLADGFTKPLIARKFNTFRSQINVNPAPEAIHRSDIE
ncbi:Retrovirus-related Pol polyprotein from transposon TNT 1-94 [Ceratocystis lukuohia]|uniref:Retrovirus-related Pol polyprotein from transposon TNT 1-94 n=1 Tax=Ceratocystis lukuohia TaxID=2019550 RepID=A0ABR4M9D1_9PEZI